MLDTVSSRLGSKIPGGAQFGKQKLVLVLDVLESAPEFISLF